MFSHFLRTFAAPTRTTHRVERDGWVWHLTPAGRDLFGDAGPDPAAWPAVVVKQNLQRTVSRAEVNGAAVYVKRCRPNTPRAWLRELVRPAKARLEFDNAQAVGRRAVPAPRPLGWGTPAGRGPRESVLLTLEVAGEPPAERRRLTRLMARLMAVHHARGVDHPDPHPGNYLVEPTPAMALIDLHAVHLGPPLDRARTVRSLVLFNRYFQMRASRPDRLRFWRAYVADRPVLAADADRLVREIERATADSNRRFWVARQKRHLGDNRDTHRVRGPAARGWAARDLPADLVAAWLADPDAPLRQPGAVTLKDSRTSTVARVETPAGPVAYKRFNLKSWLLPLKALGRRPPAVRSWLAGLGLLDRDLPTARPLACFQRHRVGLPTVGYLVCEWVPDAVELPTAVTTLTPAGRRDLAWRLGRLVRLMRTRDIRHRDFKAANILVTNGRPMLVDLVGVHTGRDRPGRELSRLAASLAGSPHVGNADRLRCLLASLGSHEQHAWKDWWRVLTADVAVKLGQTPTAAVG